MKFLSPVDGLIVNKAADAVLTIKNDSSNNSHHAKLQLYSLRPDGTNYSSSSLYLDNYSTYLSADEALHLQTNGATRLFIHGSGNVGIGTNSPSKTLDVNGTARVGGELFFSHFDAFGANSRFRDNLRLYFGTGRVFNLHYDSSGDDLRIASGSSSIMTFDSNSNVGIGTTTPAAKLHVIGEIRGTSSLKIRGVSDTETHATISTNGNEGVLQLTNGNNWGFIAVGSANDPKIGAYHGGSLIVRGFGHPLGSSHANDINLVKFDFNNQRVGIGTTSPTRALSVKASSSSMVADFRSASGNNSYVSFSNNASTADQVRLGSTSGSLVLSTNYTERVRVASDGNVGINVTNPTSKLTVNGTAKFYEYGGSHLTNQAHSSFNFEGLVSSSSSTNGGTVGAYVKITASATSATGAYNAFRSRAYAENTTVNTESLTNYFAEYRNYTSTSAVTLSHHRGLWVKALGVGGNATVTNNYGVFLEVGTAATNNYGIYQSTNAAKNYFAGNVGIGTTSPASKLDVNGAITLSGDSEHTIQRLTTSSINSASTHVTEIKGRQIDLYAYDDIWLRAGTGDNIGFEAGNATRMYIKSDGNVGIGLTDPTSKLETLSSASIRSAANASHKLRLESRNDYYNDIQSAGIWISDGDLGGAFSGAGAHLVIEGRKNSARHIHFKVGDTTSPQHVMLANGNVGIGTTSPSEKLDVVGSIELTQHLKATGNNLSFSAGGNQILNIDLNGKIYPSSHNAKDLGFNRGLAFKDVYATGLKVGTASTISEHNTTGALRITTQHGYTSIGAENSSWSHFNTDRAAFYFNKRIEIAGELVPYHANSHNLGTSTKPWVRIYGTTIYQGADRVLATRPDVHTALYSTGGNADDYTQFGIYRNYGEGQPTGLGHNTVLHVSQTDGNYGWQITSSTANGADSMWYRQKGTTFGDGTWHQIASRSWVTSQGYASASGNATQAWVNAQAFAPASGNATQAWVQAQGYITSQTDSQTLSWGSANGQLTISSGNTVDLDGRYMYGAVTNGGDFNDLTSGKNSDYVAFNASNITDAPDASWYNGLVTTHGNYLSSYIVNKHRTNDWYLSWRDANVTPSANWSRVWHSNDFTATNVNNWNTAYGWGNHGAAGYLTAVPSGYATETYVGTQISNLVSSAPSTLDTLNELAAALGDDPNFATTVTNSIATKLPLAGGNLTGDLTIGTASNSANSSHYGDFAQLIFDNSHSDSAKGPNKIVMHDNGSHWQGGFGIHSATVAYYSGQHHKWYKTNTDSYEQKMSLDDNGNLVITGTLSASGYNSSNWNTAYGWGNHASAGYLTSLPSHNHDDRYYTETEINNKFNSYTRYQTGSNFVDGTLVRTSIVANVTNGDSYLLEITGKSYSTENYPFKVILQGYIYNDTFISNSALSYGGDFAPTIKVFEDGGYLCFWWDRISYWNSFSVNVIDASHHDQAAENQVLSIEDAADATYTKQVVVSVRKSLNQSSDGNWTLGNSTWINHDNDTAFNSYNENIRLRNAANGASVIAFGAEGGAGTPESSLINYSDRLEIRRGNPWKIRIYDTVVFFSGNVEAAGTISATGGNSTNWNTAYGWGNHGAAGYLTSVPSEYLTQTEGDARYVTPIYNGANDNSGKADFAVGVGGDNGAAISLLGTQFQVGAQDVNYTFRLDTSGNDSRIKSWDRDIILSTDASASSTNVRHIKFYTKPNGSATIERVRIDGAGYTYFHGLQLAISNTNSSHGAPNYFRGDSTHLVIGTGGTLHLNYGGSTTVLHGTNVYPSTNGVANLGTSSAYFNRTYTNSLQGGGYTQVNDYAGGSTWYMRGDGNFIFANGHDWTLTCGLYMNQNGVPNDTFVELGQRTSNEENGRYKGIRIVKRENNTTVNGDLKAGKIQVEANANNAGSQIEFNDNIGGSQRVYLTGYHADSVSHGGGASLHLTSTESNVTMVSDRYHSIQHGTSANWKQAYDWGNHASAGYITGYTETDTLDSVLTRGDVTTNTIHIRASDRAYTFRTAASWGGWARTPFYFEQEDGTGFGGFGAYGGNGTTLSKYYIGSSYNNNIVEFHTNGLTKISGELSASGYTEIGNGIGSVSNDGGWHGRLNVAGTSHARIDAQAVGDGIITTMYSHNGHNMGKVGTMSNHSLGLMTAGSQRVILSNSDIYPSSDGSYGLGRASNKWNSLHVSGSVNTNSANIQQNVVFPNDSTGIDFYGANFLKKIQGRGMVMRVDAAREADDFLAFQHGADGPYTYAWHSGNLNPSSFASSSHTHSASQITSGTFAVARIPSLAASKITSGTFADARIASASNWNTAYGWGNHASAGYLTGGSNISVRNITARTISPEADRAYTLGSESNRWQIVFCETLDSAGQHESNLQNPKGEKSVGEYATGTVLVWKGGKNIPCTEAADHMRMGIAVNGVESPLVQGAEPVLVSGPVSEGDYLVTSSIEGHAKAISPQFMRQHGLYDCVIGKALESGEGKSYLIKTWINI